MAHDASISYGSAGRGEPLEAADRRRLQELSRKPDRSAEEQFELGGLRARARGSTAADRQLAYETANDARLTEKPTSSKTSGTSGGRRERATDSEYQQNLEWMRRYDRENPW
jgi:hypothetical protein